MNSALSEKLFPWSGTKGLVIGGVYLQTQVFSNGWVQEVESDAIINENMEWQMLGVALKTHGAGNVQAFDGVEGKSGVLAFWGGVNSHQLLGQSWNFEGMAASMSASMGRMQRCPGRYFSSQLKQRPLERLSWASSWVMHRVGAVAGGMEWVEVGKVDWERGVFDNKDWGGDRSSKDG